MEELLKIIKFDDKGLVPVITQDYKTDEILMLAYMNEEAFKKTYETGKVCYFSRSRNELWIKGETSGNFQELKSISIDCDGDTLLIKIKQTGVACHTGNYSCFFRKFERDSETGKKDKVFDNVVSGNADTVLTSDESNTDGDLCTVISELYEIIKDRKNNPKDGSYTNYLFSKGTDKILKKIGEESAEIIISSKNSSNEDIQYEIADLIYHICVLMVEKGIGLDDIYRELRRRR